MDTIASKENQIAEIARLLGTMNGVYDDALFAAATCAATGRSVATAAEKSRLTWHIRRYSQHGSLVVARHAHENMYGRAI